MNRGYKREMRLAAVLLVLTMLLPLVRFPVNATQVGGSHVVDLDNILPEEEKAVLNQILFDHNSGQGYTEAVMVVESVEKDMTAESLEFLISKVASMFGFGAMEGKQPGSLYLYINRRASGDLELQVIATDRLKDHFTNYQIDYLNAELNRFVTSQRDFKEILKFFLNLKSIYTYPVINEMGEESISLDVLRKAAEEIKAWRGKYQQAIVILLNKRFGDGLYEKYREDYFMSQGYGEGEKRSGIFLIYDQSLNRFDVSFYGDTSRNFDRQQLDLLKNELSKHLESLDILEVVYSIERFLTPQETIPMVTLPGTDELKSDSQSKKPEVSKKQDSVKLPEVSKEEKRMDKTLLFIIIGVLVVLVIFVLIMILAGKNKKGSSAHPGNYPNQPNRGNYPNQAMPQNYSNPMQQGYQGYGNTPAAGVYGNQGMQQQPYAQAQGYQNQVGQGQSAYANPQTYSQPYGNQGTYSQPYNGMPSQNYQQAYHNQMPQGYPQTSGNHGVQAAQFGQPNYNPSAGQGYPQADPQSQSSPTGYYNEGPQQK